MRGRPSLLVFIDLIQDIDVLLPILIALRAEERWSTRILVARWLHEASPRTEIILQQHGLRFRWVLRSAVKSGLAPSLHGVGALLTASESSEPTHVAGHRLAKRANARGIATFTLQHGFENVGLVPSADGNYAHFASTAILTWGPPPHSTPSATCAKLIPVGRPVAVGPADAFDIAVFENLHWERYLDGERRAFQAGLEALLSAETGQRILVRAHPAGGWLDPFLRDFERNSGAVTISSVQARSQIQSGRSLAAAAKRVITTPSTVAVDAAGASVATAIAGASRDAGPYSPLRVLATPEDWISFAKAPPDVTLATAFAEKVLLPGDAVANVVGRLAAALGH